MDEEGWRRLGRAVLHERTRHWRTREDFARASGVSARTLDDLETGRRDNYLDTTLAAVEIALGWQAGTCMRIVGGGRIRRELDPNLARIMAAWPRMSPDARSLLADIAERALESKG